ncbi:MAG: Glu/Leu/Phe/Val dehydrogenase [Chitinophagales bacterium]
MQTASENLTSVQQTNGLFDQLNNYEHEQLVFCQDKATGLKCIIGIHNTTLGPALGGTRFYNYKNEADAITDVLRLSRGMTYKNAISGINLGGGKAVIIGDPAKLSNEFLWRRYGKFIDSLHGKYYTAEDVGTSIQDMEYVSQETEFVAGLPDFLGGGGDPSPVTAYGVYLGIKAGAKKKFGSDDLSKYKILVEGVGNVGSHLLSYLSKENAKIYICDVNTAKLKAAAEKYGAEVVALENALDLDIDIYAPCALGASINDESISRLKCGVIAGAANNQLKNEQVHAQMLVDKDILYAPDFLINAGGVINCYAEVNIKPYNRDYAYRLTESIYDKAMSIFEQAEKLKITTHEAAFLLAKKRIQSVAQLRAVR